MNISQLFVAFYTSALSTNRYGEFELRTDNNNIPGSLLAVSNSNIAISYIDGTLSDSSNLASRSFCLSLTLYSDRGMNALCSNGAL